MRWVTLPEFPDYEISEAGDVRRATPGGRRYPIGYVLTPKPHQRGYVYYILKTKDGGDKTMLGHRLVALAFLGEPPTIEHEVAHDDGTRTNNHWRNLRWATPLENQADRKRHGTTLSGYQLPHTKLNGEQAEEIRAAYAAGGQRYAGGAVTMQELADKYGVAIVTISRVVNGIRWQAAA